MTDALETVQMIYKHFFVVFVEAEGNHGTMMKIEPDISEERQPTAYRNLRLVAQNLAQWNVIFFLIRRKNLICFLSEIPDPGRAPKKAASPYLMLP